VSYTKEEKEQMLKEAEEYFKDKNIAETDILTRVDTLSILIDKLQKSGIICTAFGLRMTKEHEKMIQSMGESLEEFIYIKIVTAEADAGNIINFFKNTGLPTARTAQVKAIEEFYDPDNKGSVQ